MNLSVSSTYDPDGDCCRPLYAIDRVFSHHTRHGYYVSETSSNPWFIMTFEKEILLERVIIWNSWLYVKAVMEDTFRNIYVRAGIDPVPSPTDGSKILANEECKRNETTSELGTAYSFKCRSKVEVKIISIQRINTTEVILIFDEIEIIGKGNCSCNALFYA